MCPVKTCQSIVGADPEHSKVITKYCVDKAIGQPLGDAHMVEVKLAFRQFACLTIGTDVTHPEDTGPKGKVQYSGFCLIHRY